MLVSMSRTPLSENHDFHLLSTASLESPDNGHQILVNLAVCCLLVVVAVVGEEMLAGFLSKETLLSSAVIRGWLISGMPVTRFQPLVSGISCLATVECLPRHCDGILMLCVMLC